MSRFVSNTTQQIEFGDGESVEVRQTIPFSEMEPIMLLIDKDNEIANIKVAMPLLKASLVGWNLKDDAGNLVEFGKEKINDLDIKTILELLPILTDLYFPKKKIIGQINKIIIFKSQVEKGGYDQLMDYRMSEKFGLDWKEYSNERMRYFMVIMNAEAEREAKTNSKNQTYGRHNNVSNNRA